MNNPEDKQGQGQRQGQNLPTDKGEDAEDRQGAADRAWKEREQGGRSAGGRVGGSDPTRPAPEIEQDDVEREGGRTSKDDVEKGS